MGLYRSIFSRILREFSRIIELFAIVQIVCIKRDFMGYITLTTFHNYVYVTAMLSTFKYTSRSFMMHDKYTSGNSKTYNGSFRSQKGLHLIMSVCINFWSLLHVHALNVNWKSAELLLKAIVKIATCEVIHDPTSVRPFYSYQRIAESQM